jgi:hypothetical protein
MQTKRYRYQIQFACFQCRKAYKRPNTLKEQERSAWLSQRRISGKKTSKAFAMPIYRCPECARILTMMGRAFRAPRRENIAQWQKVELLTRGGLRFNSSALPLQGTLNEAKKYMGIHRKISKGEKLATKIHNRKD